MSNQNNTVDLGDFSGPLSKGFGEKILPLVNRSVAHQAVAASASVALAHHGCPVQLEPGKISELFVVLGGGVVPGAGESMTVDVEESTDGGSTWASILSAPKTLDATITDAEARIDLMGLLANPTHPKVLSPLTRLRATLVYTAGATPAPLASTIVVAGIVPIL